MGILFLPFAKCCDFDKVVVTLEMDQRISEEKIYTSIHGFQQIQRKDILIYLFYLVLKSYKYKYCFKVTLLEFYIIESDQWIWLNYFLSLF